MKQTDQNIAILGIGTSLPQYRLDQIDTAERISQALSDDPNSARWTKRLFRQCGVESRYTCEPNLLEPAENCRYFSQKLNNDIPTTSERMAIYKRESVPLGAKAARKALEDGRVDPSEVTHIITVSCTGQFLPGMDTELVKLLGLPMNVNRIPLTFLGCAAGLKAICLAKELLVNHTTGKVLVVSVELCTLHMQPSSSREALFGASFFGDGASACIIGNVESEEHTGIFQLGKSQSVILPGGADEMIWEVADYGFDLYLSPNIPKLIAEYVPEQIERLMQGEQKPNLWAIHPGGKGIIDKLAEIYDLTEEQTSPSRTVLKNYGNMSSTTILFVLDEMRQQLNSRGERTSSGVTIAFGPGLSCELIQISYQPQAIPQKQVLDETFV